MKFCSECGARLPSEGPDSHGIIICPRCQHCIRRHPKLLVACYVHCGPRLLWMRRALAPKRGYWAIPAGFMEQGETLAEASARELWEETGLRIPPEQLQLYMMGTISFISEVYVAFHAEVPNTYCETRSESLEVAFFSRDELPWDEIAYPEANHSIIQAYDNIEAGEFHLYHCEMTADKNRLDLIPER